MTVPGNVAGADVRHPDRLAVEDADRLARLLRAG